jgi:hypothetical protein
VTKWEQWLDFFFVVIAIANEDPFAIAHFAMLARIVDIGRVILQTDRKGGRQLARWIYIAEQHVGQCVALLLAVVPEL